MAIGIGYDCLSPVYLNVPGCPGLKFRAPCNRCINCKARRAREWCLRLAMEAKYWQNICFCTLTYAPEFVPVTYRFEVIDYLDDFITVTEPVFTLSRKETQLFMKRLRKHLDYKIKYYAVGEYGSRTNRPHYHIMLFGLKESDYHFIAESWQKGFVDVRPFFPETCSYIAGYIQKKLYGDNACIYRVSEFLRCSQHLGERYLFDTIGEYSDERPYIIYQGYKHPIPRTFRKKLVELGVLSSPNMLLVASDMKLEYYKLVKHLKSQGIDDIVDFWRQRRENAKFRHMRMTASRDENLEV